VTSRTCTLFAWLLGRSAEPTAVGLSVLSMVGRTSSRRTPAHLKCCPVECRC